jgi:hypothetical protein
LPPPERRVVELCYREGKTLSQAAREIGIGRSWASRLRARALANLRTAVSQSPSLPPQSPSRTRQLDRCPPWNRQKRRAVP